MCINPLAIIFDTPPLEDDPATVASTKIYRCGFQCDTYTGGNIWLEELSDNEDGRYVLNSHPLSDA